MKKKSRLRKLICETLENRNLLAGDWQNPGQPLDVSHDLSLSPLDALVGINRLNSGANRTLPPRAAESSEPYYDVDGNGLHNPLDILLVINALNSRKPTVAVELLNDTGVGAGASTDRISKDISVRGAIRLGAATQLWGRIDSDANWQNFTQFVSANQTFSIPQSELVKAFGRELTDGNHTLRFQARFGSNYEQLGAEVDLPVTLDTSSLELNVNRQSDSPATIIVSSPNVIAVPLGERASPATLVASKIKLYDATFDKLQPGAVEISPRGVSVSSDGRTLLVDAPANEDSTKYLIAVGEGSFEDAAGNRNSAFEAFANQYNQSTSSPIDWNDLTIATANKRRVAEYTFSLSGPDLFMMNYLRASSSAQIELFAPSGRSVLSWEFGPIGGERNHVLGNLKMLREVGEYRLRIALPSVSEVFFVPALASLLPSVPNEMQLRGNSTIGEAHAYNLTVGENDRFFFKNNTPQPVISRVLLFGPDGEFAHASVLSDGTVVDAPIPGTYVVFIDPFSPGKFDYSLLVSKTVELPLAFGQYYEQSFEVPGQRAIYSFPTIAARTYTLEFDSPSASVELILPNSTQSDTAYQANEDGQGFVRLTFDRSDLASARARFRVVETASTYKIPAPNTVHVEQLQPGITERKFQVPNESYQFNFNASANDLYGFAYRPQSDRNQYVLIAPTGSEIYPSQFVEGFEVFRIPYAGQYQLRAFSGYGLDVAFQWQKLSQATPLVDSGDVQVDLQESFFTTFHFTAKDSRFFAYNTNSNVSVVWYLIDSRGKFLGNSSSFSNEIDQTVEVGEEYTLFVRSQISLGSRFDFRRTTPVTNSSAAAIGESISGQLAARGDRQVLELDLTAGQLIQLTSNVDPSIARIRWLDAQTSDIFGIQVIDPAWPDRISASRLHHVEIQNLSSTAIEYSLQFNSVSPPAAVPVQLVGFDQIHSGTVGDTPLTFEFEVSKGAMYLFDWLLPDAYDLSLELKDATGQVVPNLYYGIDSFHVAETAGVFRLKISNPGSTPSPFSFRLLSPDIAESVTVDAEKTVSVIPYGTAIFRIPLAAPTELFLDAEVRADGNSTWLYRNAAATGPAGQSFEYLSALGQFFDGEGVVWVTNISAEPYDTTFTVRDVSRIPLLPLDTPITFSSELNRRYVIPFQTTAPVTVSAQSRYDIMDQDGNFIAADRTLENAAYNLMAPGFYRAIVAGDFDSTTFELHTQHVTEKIAQVGEKVTDELARIGDIHRYRFQLNAGTPLNLGFTFGEGRSARWITPDGEVITHIQLGTQNFLPVYQTGEYQLEIFAYSSQVQYAFQLIDLSRLVPITAGTQTGSTTPGVATVLRISGSPHQLFQVQANSNSTWSLVDRLGSPLETVGYINTLLPTLPDDGDAFLVIYSATSGSTDYSFNVSFIDSEPTEAPIGQPIFGTLLPNHFGKHYLIHVDEPTWLRVEARGTSAIMIGLKLPNGNSNSSTQELYTLLLAGDHELQIYSVFSEVNDFRLTIDLLNQKIALPMDQFAPIDTNETYRVDIPETGRYELQLRDSNNVPVSIAGIGLRNLRGEFAKYVFEPRGTLQKGSYWLNLNVYETLPTGIYSLRVVPIESTHSTLAVGALGTYELNPSGLQERIVRIPLPFGGRYIIEQLGIEDGTLVEARLDSSFPFEWRPIDELPRVMISELMGFVEFRISGTGSARIRLIDLNVAPVLELGSSQSVTLDATVRAHAWLIDGQIGDRIELVSDLSTEKPVIWMIVDEGLNVIGQYSHLPLSLSIMNRQRFALIMFSNTRLDSAVVLPFRSVVFR